MSPNRSRGRLPSLMLGALTLAGTIALPGQALASLTELMDDYADELQRQAAISVQQTYNDLIAMAGCRDRDYHDPGDEYDEYDEREWEYNKPGTGINDYHHTNQPGQCTGQTFALFDNLRKLVHSANALVGSGSTEFSLDINIVRLGNALRWNAAEEYAAQGSLSNEFAKGQLDGLASRLGALRLGASGFSLGLVPAGSTNALALAHTSGGGASADEFSRWGGFLNYAYTSGKRAPTSFENAFDFRGHEITLGTDYRLLDNLVVGGVFGLVDQSIEFDSRRSVVGGGVESSGFSLMPFAMYYFDNFYISGSLGYQRLSFDSSRTIRYASLNPDVSGVDTAATSKTSGRILSQFAEAGYTFSHGALTLEPYFNLNMAQIRIDGFVEEDINNDAYDMIIDDQKYNSLEGTLGVTVQYTFSPPFGVLIPYASVEQVTQARTKSRTLGARYASAATSESLFDITTDELDGSYNVVTLGLASVIRGARQRTLGSAVSGGVQGFVHYQRVENLKHHDIDMISLGLRYEF